MKLHRNLVFATIDSLHLIFNEKKQADKVLKNTLKRDKRGALEIEVLLLKQPMILLGGNVYMQKLLKLKNLLTVVIYLECFLFGLH